MPKMPMRRRIFDNLSKCMSDEQNVKAKALANGVEVWCSFEELAKVDALKENPKNPNKHPDSQIELLAKNIKYLGWRHPITVSKRSGFIVAGHGRLMAAKKLGLKIVPVDYQDFNSDADEIAGSPVIEKAGACACTERIGTFLYQLFKFTDIHPDRYSLVPGRQAEDKSR